MLHGLNFAPTPKWTSKIKDHEYLNLTQHVRRVEWDNVITDNNQDNSNNTITPKLRIPKFNRPDYDLVDEKILAYTVSVTSKLQNIETAIKKYYSHVNNLNYQQRQALDYLSKLFRNEKIVICKADKDDKIIILNFEDYNLIMKRELEKFIKIHDLNTDNYKLHLKSVQQSAEKFVIELHELDVIDDNLLKHTIGVKFYEGKGYQKVPGSLAKYFNCEKPGYAYPLFKTHTLHPDKLIEASIF